MKKTVMFALFWMVWALDVAAQSPPLTDAQIVTIIADISEIDIEAASWRNSSPRIRKCIFSRTA